jgi:hypothetical protein
MSDTLGPQAAVPPPSGRWAAFRRIVCLPYVAAAFHLAFVLALSRVIAWHPRSTHWFDWIALLAQFTRQCFISVLCILLFAGLAEAALSGVRASATAAWALRAMTVAVGSMVGALMRYTVMYIPDFNEPFQWSWFAYTSGLWWLLGYMGYGVLQLVMAERAGQERLSRARQARETLAAQQLEAELSALQAQIEPHFLFNTLATVKRLYDVAPGLGRDMLASLIAYLRTALPGMRSQHACLADELERVRHYLAILQMRMGERLRFEIQAPDDLRDAEMPPMVIATLVENAIKHGLSPLPEGGCLRVSARRTDDGRLEVDVCDDGRGFVGAGGSGVGLANTRARLLALYGNQASLSLQALEPRGVLARVTLPWRHGPAPAASPMPDEAPGVPA